ncbi:MAG TPA: HNH endonuclease signature motif containing protein, partial [Mycobacterium sp.]|nr:HNH endonuclease signature motif containing protein [Mycobacterium sp.]
MFSDRDAVVAAFDALDAALEAVLGLSFAALTTPERFAGLQRLETVRRRLPVAEHQLINGVAEQASCAEIGGRLSAVLADRLRITTGEAARRVGDAALLGTRQTLTGQPVAPLLAATAARQRAGQIGAGHIREIRRFLDRLPAHIDAPTRVQAEADLARLATRFRPDEVARAGERLAALLNPDGDFSDEDRARKRGLIIGAQDIDGMSPISGYLTPEARAGLDAILAKWAAPGMCNPDDQTPTLDDPPDPHTAQRDGRSRAQRNHDALNAMCRALLASGQLGSHHGLPVSLVISTTLTELESAAGIAVTGGGSWLPMREVIRLASHARHYLAVFDQHTQRPLYLGETKRIATPAQRIVLHAKDRGCTYPGCTVPGYLSEVHHITGWANSHRTDIDDLTFGCHPHHTLLDEGWT